MVGDAACNKDMPMLDQEEQDNTVKAVVRVENAGTEKEEKSSKATHVARPKTGGGVKRLSDADIHEGRVKGRLDIEDNLEGASCKVTNMNDEGREKMKQVNTKEKTHETRTKKVQESKSQKLNNGGKKKRYKTLALAVKRHQEMSEERMKKQNLLFSSVSKNLSQIDLLLGRMD